MNLSRREKYGIQMCCRHPHSHIQQLESTQETCVVAVSHTTHHESRLVASPGCNSARRRGHRVKPVNLSPMQIYKRKRKADEPSTGRRRKAPHGPELPRALVKEIGCAVPAPRRTKGHDKKKPISAARSAANSPKHQAKSVHNDPVPDSIHAELQMQAMLAKKLKIRKGQSTTGPDDGLDGLLNGLEDLDGTVPKGKSEITQLLSDNESTESEDPGFVEEGGTDAEDSEDLQELSQDDSNDNSSIAEEDLNAGSQGADPSPFTEGDSALQNDHVADHTAQAVRTKAPASQSSAAIGAARRLTIDQQGDATQRNTPSSGHARPGNKYIPPAMRGSKVADQAGMQTRIRPEQAAVKRQIRSLLNRVAAANLKGIASEIAGLFGSMPRRFINKTLVQSLMKALEEGPRAADQFAAVMSCLIVMVSALSNVQELLANTLLALADGLERSRNRNDSIASSNTTRVICCLYLCKGIGSKVMYSLLEHLKAGFSDGDVHLMLLTLNTVGYELRGDDAVGMKEFIENVHAKSSSCKAENVLSQRARLMLELIVDIKNNRKHKAGGVYAGLEASLPAVTLKQLKECNADLIALDHITWAQLCSNDLRGAWWLSTRTNMTVEDCDSDRPFAAVAAHPESSALLELASKQRMNTDSRRAIFCVLMSADDHGVDRFDTVSVLQLDAVERLMRLPLKGTADRDIAHVLLHCCMQEQRWNPFYGHVAAELLVHSKMYKNSIQFAVQDRLRQIPELNARQATHLASFVAHLIANRGLPLSVFKVVDLETCSKRRALFCRYCMQQLLLQIPGDDDVRTLFSKLQNAETRAKLLYFLQRNMGPWVAGHDTTSHQESLLLRIQAAESALKPGF